MIVVARGWPVVTPATPSFSDVPTTNPFYGYIETAQARMGVISGYGTMRTFRPEQHVTRGQISKMIVSAFAWAINTAGGPHFTDVPASDPFYGFVETAFNHNVISGYGDRTFRPGNPVTRAQLSKMLYAALGQ